MTNPAPLADLSALRIEIDRRAAQVQFGGVTVAGLCRFNVQVPPDTPDGDAKLVAQIGSARTQDSGLRAVPR